MRKSASVLSRKETGLETYERLLALCPIDFHGRSSNSDSAMRSLQFSLFSHPGWRVWRTPRNIASSSVTLLNSLGLSLESPPFFSVSLARQCTADRRLLSSLRSLR
ncbi:uncharacterized protein STEHIDRAFT_122947 [Stereum hirsutum FP-91666 SS1]|uniref:uncharacterized protein n=1 Tax=Stereum hirsutum (strain FP-91666) TaxID=721885 RepID=UPI000444A4DF|nr:uncharacterized protein STEHIDRAFT_122947 [Stereum hirsutum FP-91666 SS1]EIM85047.1 hypothetical protein STEHIDRAFT_122947 [Stereum hirsutum FP-91666 SS1]